MGATVAGSPEHVARASVVGAGQRGEIARSVGVDAGVGDIAAVNAAGQADIQHLVHASHANGDPVETEPSTAETCID